MRTKTKRPDHLVLRKLLSCVGEAAGCIGDLNRDELREGRRCVGCEEALGERLEPVLGWVCLHCDEVLDLVYDIEIERVEEARRKIEIFTNEIRPA